MTNFLSITGKVTQINVFGWGTDQGYGCYQLMSVVQDHGEQVNFVVAPETYVIDHQMIQIGDRITGFYNGNTPVPLIYPPQYRAIVLAPVSKGESVSVDYFDEQLMSSDGYLQLNITPHTRILTENGQQFTASITNRNLIVSYGPSTKSIPAQTSPDMIVVMCRDL